MKHRLENHMRTVHLLEPSPCEVCGKIFDNPFKLKNHIRFNHENRVPRKKVYDRSDWTCPICSKVVRACYKRHHLKIHEEPKYTCDICGKKLKTKHNFDHHMNSHMNILDHKCEPCNKVFLLFFQSSKGFQAFPSRDALQQHFRRSVAHRNDK